ncbi:ferredoxin--NADP reductase [Mycolicibacterium pulveris]|uniref:3-ketosteroid-9-alpha-hydroxylase reductase subunit n=1 Tax=Mycolicibacterium pulveris TaxID=36813 RepID=A0A7I7UQU9_MYCPV|nr:ferredoxin--NADP reductase [Mycolicibacterium pulveris]MCV6983824.1 ferredoxin--NADP reductase [Mycolicibacterium pulveris]BBY83707.1 3-ketosteroid-9-alpha-hydroxylase reductase subunit [Mycolicibacterium pulveris]
MADADGTRPRHAVLTVSEVVQETASAISLKFDRPSCGDFRYQPGQFLTFRIPGDDRGSVARCYSLSSSPATDDHLKVTIKRIAGGYGSNWFADNAVVGSEFEVLPPAGVFTPKSYDNDLLAFAGGSGITPIMSIVKSVLTEGKAGITVVYANRDDRDVIFARELDELCRAHCGRLTVIHWLDSLQGLPTPELLTRLVSPLTYTDVFVCGPAPFMAAVRNTLTGLNFDQNRLHTEVFTSLSNDPFATNLSPESAGAATAHVEIDGLTHVLDWPRNRSLVDTLVDAGIEVPYACREGECGACVCTVTDGQVTMNRVDILEADDVAGGLALGCQARPASDEVSVTFD